MAYNGILVTGFPRGGTTLVGTILASLPSTTYVYEPFNISQPTGICNSQFPYWFMKVGSENWNQYEDGLNATVGLKYNLLGQIKGAKRTKDWMRLLADFPAFTVGRIRGCTPILKDPISLFSADWLAKQYSLKVIVMTRHPAAFVVSRMRRNDRFDFKNLSEQNELIDGLLKNLRGELLQATTNKISVVEEHALLWKALAVQIEEYMTQNPNWCFLAQEEIAADPIAAFRKIIEYLELDWSRQFERTVSDYCMTSKRVEPMRVGKLTLRSLRRDSRHTVKTWDGVLSPDEVAVIKQSSNGLLSCYYGDESWV